MSWIDVDILEDDILALTGCQLVDDETGCLDASVLSKEKVESAKNMAQAWLAKSCPNSVACRPDFWEQMGKALCGEASLFSDVAQSLFRTMFNNALLACHYRANALTPGSMDYQLHHDYLSGGKDCAKALCQVLGKIGATNRPNGTYGGVVKIDPRGGRCGCC